MHIKNKSKVVENVGKCTLKVDARKVRNSALSYAGIIKSLWKTFSELLQGKSCALGNFPLFNERKKKTPSDKYAVSSEFIGFFEYNLEM